MYKVLIVDDEPIVREGLQYIIDWESYGFTVVGTAENGKIGLEKIYDLKPELIITDIKMPGMSGIEMVREAKKTNLSSRFIILSGYSDFSYAQEAMSLGMLFYLLKPIDEDELICMLKQEKIQLDEQKTQHENAKKYEDYTILSKIKAYILNNETSKEINCLTTYNSYQLIGCHYNHKKTSQYQLREIIPRTEEFTSFVFNHGNCLYILLCQKENKKIDRFQNQLLEQLNQLTSRVYISVSQKSYSVKQLQALYQEIVELEEKRYLFPTLPVLSYEIIKARLEGKDGIRTTRDELKNKLTDAIKERKRVEIIEILRQYTEFYQYSNWTVERMKADLANLVLYCIEFLESIMEKPVKEQEKNKIISVILAENSIVKTIEFLNEVFNDFGRFFYETYEKQDIVDEIVRYTKKNYHKDLNLAELAKEFNYSYSYLGKKFRAEKKISYHNYLDKVRIEQAKKLIKSGSYYVYEIAEKVGYSNSDYFHKKFKKIMGVSPKQYQKKTLENGDKK